MMRLCSFVCLLSVLFSFEGFARGRWSPPNPAHWPDSKDGEKDLTSVPLGCLPFKDYKWPVRVETWTIPEVHFTQTLAKRYIGIIDHRDAEGHIFLRERRKGTTDNILFNECHRHHNGPCISLKEEYRSFSVIRQYFKEHKQSELEKRYPTLLVNFKCMARPIYGSLSEKPQNYHWFSIYIKIDPIDKFMPTLQIPSRLNLGWDIQEDQNVTAICGEDKDIFVAVARFKLCLGEESEIGEGKCNREEYFFTDEDEQFRKRSNPNYFVCQFLYLKKPLLNFRNRQFNIHVKLIPHNRTETPTSPITIHVADRYLARNYTIRARSVTRASPVKKVELPK